MVKIVHCVVARPTYLTSGIAILPMPAVDLEVVEHVVVSRTVDVHRLKTLLRCQVQQ